MFGRKCFNIFFIVSGSCLVSRQLLSSAATAATKVVGHCPWQTSNCMPIPPCHVREGVFPSCSNQSRVSTSSNRSYETLEIQQIRCSFSVGGSPAILRVSTSKVKICRDRNAIMVCVGSSPIAEITWSKYM